ncbi:MAG: hypothetical protein DME65_12655 [Verrucomicrobia bacterium]|nr:MAG: hypothetical protein DME65_12655 [Verrucomicrobiota bacterium]
MTVSLLEADIAAGRRHVCFVPQAEIWRPRAIAMVYACEGLERNRSATGKLKGAVECLSGWFQ